MKFIHLGDLHLGKTVSGYSMTEDQRYILDKLLEYSRENEIQAMVIAGDVYDKSVPSIEAVNLFDDFLIKASAQGLYLYIISGNHDSEDRLNFGSRHFLRNHIYIQGRFEGELKKYFYRDEFGRVNVYLLPFIRASRVRYYYSDAKIETYEDAVRTVIENAGVNWNERNIILSHQYVTGEGTDPEVSGSEIQRPDTVGTVEKISSKVFENFDYAALGHIHSPQKVGRDYIRYSGSPLKYSLREVNHRKSFPVVTIGKDGFSDVELVSISPVRDLRHLTGTFEEITRNAEDTDDYIYATLTDENIIADAMNRLKAYYPNTLHVDYMMDRMKNEETFEYENPFEKKSFREIIGDFYRKQYDREMNDEEWKIIEELSRKAGIEQ